MISPLVSEVKSFMSIQATIGQIISPISLSVQPLSCTPVVVGITLPGPIGPAGPKGEFDSAVNDLELGTFRIRYNATLNMLEFIYGGENNV